MDVNKIRGIILEEFVSLLAEKFDSKNTFIVDMGWKKGFKVKSSTGETMKLGKYAVWSTMNDTRPGQAQVIDHGDNLNSLKKKYNTDQVIKLKEGLLREAPEDDKEKADKEKQDIQKQKNDLTQQKLDFQKQQAADADREADKRDAEKEKADTEKDKEAGEQGEQPKEKPMNLKFNDQGLYYSKALPVLKNFVLSNENQLTNDEKHYIALAIQASNGRVDGGLKKFLQKGKARNVYGKDFSEDDINRIIKFSVKQGIVR